MSTCLGGAFVGSLFSGWLADGVGRRRAFQLCALPMIIGASLRSAYILARFILFFSNLLNNIEPRNAFVYLVKNAIK